MDTPSAGQGLLLYLRTFNMEISEFIKSECCDAPIGMTDGYGHSELWRDIRTIICMKCYRWLDLVENEALFHFEDPEGSPSYVDWLMFTSDTTNTP